jgi:DNA-binding LacI/PurR family transcriptional regulator
MPNRTRAAPTHGSVGGPSPIVGVLVDSLEDSYQWSVLEGAMDAARDLGVHLLCFAGGVLEAPRGDGGERNGVFDLAGPTSVDALVVMSGAIGNRIGPDRLARYCERYFPLPICSIAVDIAGMSSVCIDNDSGIRAMIEHLVRVHAMRRIAFVRGPAANSEAERRFAVYREALDSNGIPFSPELVAIGDFEPRGGRRAVAALLQGQKVAVGDLDAIVAANDAMALGVLDELSRLGIRVPDQLAVVGFDDIEESRFAMPPLTTVRQPLYEQGRDAVRIVIDQVRTGTVSERVVRRTQLVLRRSCGCPGPHASSKEPDPPRSAPDFESAPADHRQIVGGDAARASRGEPKAAGTDWEERLLGAERVQAWRRMRAERRARSLGRAAAAISAAHDLDDLSRAVTEHLPALGIARCYLATFDRSVGAERLARVALVHTPDAQRAEAPSWQLQPAVEILRHHVLPSGGARAMAVLPTVRKDDELGILVLELEAVEGYMYETLRDVFTTALAGARLAT